MVESHANIDIGELKERALKITEALYRTTDIMFDGEPLKWSLRQSALEIMNIVSGLNPSQVNEANKLDNLIKNLFFKLELASSGTYISKMNFDVLRREYSFLNNNVLEQAKTPILLDLPVYRTKSDISDKVIMSDMSEKKEKETQQKFEPEVLEPKETIKAQEQPKEPNSDRKSVIVSALKNSGPSSISDVARLFNGTIGEKTVQRELNSLVGVGIIKKEGEKRWRRYFL